MDKIGESFCNKKALIPVLAAVKAPPKVVAAEKTKTGGQEKDLAALFIASKGCPSIVINAQAATINAIIPKISSFFKNT